MKTAASSIARVGLTLCFLLAASGLAAQTNVSGTISTNTTWTVAGSPYIVTGDVFVENSAAAPVLTIQAGVTVKFNAGFSLWIGNSYPGSLQAVGTSASPITFTANGSTSPGFWRGIRIRPSATSTQISYATVSYGGLTGNWGGIHIESSSPTISNVTVSNNSHSGISISGGSASISASTISSNPTGIMTWNLATPSLQTLTISNNTGFAISQDCNQTMAALSGLTLTGNGTNGIELRTGSVALN